MNYALTSNNQTFSHGIKTFTNGPTPEQQFKPIVKIFPDLYTA